MLKVARQLKTPVRMPPRISPVMLPMVETNVNRLIAAPPAGRARRMESRIAVTINAIPTPSTKRPPSTIGAFIAAVTSAPPTSSSEAPVAAVRAGPIRSASRPAGKPPRMRPQKKSEKTSPAAAALIPRSSRRLFNAGDVASTAQKVKIAIAPANGNGNAAVADVDRANGFEGANSVSAAVMFGFRMGRDRTVFDTFGTLHVSAAYP